MAGRPPNIISLSDRRIHRCNRVLKILPKDGAPRRWSDLVEDAKRNRIGRGNLNECLKYLIKLRMVERRQFNDTYPPTVTYRRVSTSLEDLTADMMHRIRKLVFYRQVEKIPDRDAAKKMVASYVKLSLSAVTLNLAQYLLPSDDLERDRQRFAIILDEYLKPFLLELPHILHHAPDVAGESIQEVTRQLQRQCKKDIDSLTPALKDLSSSHDDQIVLLLEAADRIKDCVRRMKNRP